MTACQIDGKQCTACCRAIILPGYPAHQLRDRAKHMDWDKDLQFIRKHWKPMSRRRAKIANPYLFSKESSADLAKISTTPYYHCTQVTEAGCGAYADRPKVCSGYPVYPNSPHRNHYRNSILTRSPEYHPQCTEWKIPVQEICDD